MPSEEICTICRGSGWIVDSDNNARPCECYRKKLRSNKIKFANIPESFKDMRLNTISGGYYRDKACFDSVCENIKYWIDNVSEMVDKGIGLYFWSDTKGSGKTRMATSLANELIYEYNMNVRFVTSIDILAEIRATWDKDNTEFASESQLIKYLTTTDVLIIDDFGTEHHGKNQGWIDDKFYQIVNTRYVNKLITIYTSNHELEKLSYDDRIINRIVERTYPIHFPEESVRTMIAAIRQQELGGA